MQPTVSCQYPLFEADWSDMQDEWLEVVKFAFIGVLMYIVVPLVWFSRVVIHGEKYIEDYPFPFVLVGALGETRKVEWARQGRKTLGCAADMMEAEHVLVKVGYLPSHVYFN